MKITTQKHFKTVMNKYCKFYDDKGLELIFKMLKDGGYLCFNPKWICEIFTQFKSMKHLRVRYIGINSIKELLQSYPLMEIRIQDNNIIILDEN